MYPQEYTQKALNTILDEREEGDFYIGWNGDEEAPAFPIYFCEEKTPFFIEEGRDGYELIYNEPGTRRFETVSYSFDPDEIITSVTTTIQEGAKNV